MTKEQITECVLEMRARDREKRGLDAKDVSLYSFDVEPMTELEGFRVKTRLIDARRARDKATNDEYNRAMGESKREYEDSIRLLGQIFKDGGGRFRVF